MAEEQTQPTGGRKVERATALTVEEADKHGLLGEEVDGTPNRFYTAGAEAERKKALEKGEHPDRPAA
jgi:hypothetical protein